MILFVGDLHNRISTLESILEDHPDAAAVIQVGDLVPQPEGQGVPDAWWRPMRLPIRYIDGNHHDYSETRHLRVPTEVRPGLIYCPRGTVETIDARRIAFLGGAESVVATEYRARGVDYWPEEESIQDEDLTPLLRLRPGDVGLLVTHTPPAYVAQELTGGRATRSAFQVERAWEHLGQPPLICGHHDRYYDDGAVLVLPFLGSLLR